MELKSTIMEYSLTRTVYILLFICCACGVRVTRIASSPDQFSNQANNGQACSIRRSYCVGRQCSSCNCNSGTSYLTQSDSCQEKLDFMRGNDCSLSFTSRDRLPTISFDELKSGKSFHYCGPGIGLQTCREIVKHCTIDKSKSVYENNGWQPVWSANEVVDLTAVDQSTKQGLLKFTGSDCLNEKYRGVLMRLSLTCSIHVFNATFSGLKSLPTCLWLAISGQYQSGSSSLKERETCNDPTVATSQAPTTTLIFSQSTLPVTQTLPSSSTEATGGTQSPATTDDVASDIPVGLIVGIVAAVVLLMVISCIVIWFFCCSPKRLKHNRSVILHPNETDIGYNTNLSEVNRGFRGKNISRLFSPHVNEMFTIQGKARPVTTDDPIYDAPCDSEDGTLPRNLKDMYAVVDKSSKCSTFARGYDNRRTPSPATSSSMYDEPGTMISSLSDLNLPPPPADMFSGDDNEVYDQPESIHVTVPPASAGYSTPDDALPDGSARGQQVELDYYHIYHEPETGN